MLARMAVCVIATVVTLALLLASMAWLTHESTHRARSSRHPHPAECVPNRLVTGEGLTVPHCFTLDTERCKWTPGCALVPVTAHNHLYVPDPHPMETTNVVLSRWEDDPHESS